MARSLPRPRRHSLAQARQVVDAIRVTVKERVARLNIGQLVDVSEFSPMFTLITFKDEDLCPIATFSMRVVSAREIRFCDGVSTLTFKDEAGLAKAQQVILEQIQDNITATADYAADTSVPA